MRRFSSKSTDPGCCRIVKKKLRTMSFPKHFSLNSMENVMRSRKNVKENEEKTTTEQENPTALTLAYVIMRLQMLLTWVMLIICCCCQEIVGLHYLLSFRKGRFSVPYAKGDKKGSIEAPFLQHLETSTSSYHGCHFDTSGSFHSVRNPSKEDYLTAALLF